MNEKTAVTRETPDPASEPALLPPVDVIEDSTGGIEAAVAAGMTAVGLCAASHIREGHDIRLRDAGAVHLAQTWGEVEVFAGQFFERLATIA